MRHLPLLLALVLLCALGTAVSAQASILPVVDQIRPFAGDEEETEAEEAEDAAEEAEIERELCEEDPEFCEEEDPEPKGKKDEGCLLKSAKASLTASPGKHRLRLTVHYKTLKPATVSVEATLQSPKGAIRLGSDHVRFQRSGVYRDTFALAEKQMKKAAAARGFAVELNVVNAPASCRIELSGPSRLARR